VTLKQAAPDCRAADRVATRGELGPCESRGPTSRCTRRRTVHLVILWDRRAAAAAGPASILWANRLS
jgi:hypothetical protein